MKHKTEFILRFLLYTDKNIVNCSWERQGKTKIKLWNFLYVCMIVEAAPAIGAMSTEKEKFIEKCVHKKSILFCLCCVYFMLLLFFYSCMRFPLMIFITPSTFCPKLYKECVPTHTQCFSFTNINNNGLVFLHYRSYNLFSPTSSAKLLMSFRCIL